MGSDGETSGGTAGRRTDAERLAIVTEAFEDGSSVSDVAERRGVSVASIYLWRRQLRAAATSDARKRPDRAPPPSPVTLVPVQIATAAEVATPSGPTRAERIEIVLANGRVLRVCESIDREHLVRLVAALESDAP